MKSMNKRPSFLIFATLFLFGVDLFKGISSKTEVVETKAATIETGTVLYLNPTSIWNNDGAHFAAYFFNATTNQWLDAEADTEKAGLFKVISPAGSFTNVIFTRMNASQTDLTWPNAWNQTEDLVFDGAKNLFTISTISEGPDGKSTGYWNSINDWIQRTPVNPGINSNKVRIWLNRKNHYDVGYRWMIKVGTTYYSTENYVIALFSGQAFAYFDIPLADLVGKTVSVVVSSVSTNLFQIETDSFVYTSGDNNIVWLVDYVADSWVLTKGAISERINAAFFAKVLEAYLTCDSNTVNGYGAFGDVDANFLPRTELGFWNMEGNLDDVYISDFESTGDYATGTREVGENTNAYDKYVRMKALYHTLPSEEKSYQGSTNATLLANLIISGLITLSFAGFIFLKRKKA